MQPSFCSGVQPGVQVVSLPRRIGARLAARCTAWYSVRPAVEPPAPPLVESPVTAPLLGSVLPLAPMTLVSQS